MANAALYRYKAYRRRRWHARPDGAPRWIMAAALLGLILLIGGGAAAAVSYGVYQGYADELVPPDEEIAKLPRGGARILDRNRTLLFEFVDDSSGLRDPVSYEDISLYLVAATIALEDTTFMTNPGVNYQGLASAAWDRFRNTSIVRNLFRPFGDALPVIETRGGSSITQQLVKNIYFSAEERSERSINQEGIERKLKETVLALELTKQYSKQQIMEWYLNQISYGNVFIGAEAASRGYFNKQAIDLTLAEAALLAAIPSCPACYDPLTLPEEAKAQRNFVLRRMHAEGMIDAGTLWETSTQPLDLDPRQFDVEAPHFVFNVVQPELERLFGEEAARSGGLVVTTTLDLEEHRAAEAILRGWITTFESSGGHNGAVVAIDPKTAEILVYVGSRDYFREDIDGQNDMASALNSPGSAFKPFTYLTAFINLGWGPGTMILDSEFPLQFWDGERPPRNPGGGYQGPITARNALGNSLNIPAIKTIMYAGVENVVAQAQSMGITTLDRGGYGPALTVGGVDVKLIDMVYGFTNFPNLGVLKGTPATENRPSPNRELNPISILKVEDRDGKVLFPLIDDQPIERPVVQEVRVAPAQETYLINSILSDSSAHCITYGCGGLTIPGRPIGVKTGTSEPYTNSNAIGDTWTIGYTPQLVVGTWFGNADNSPMTGITSTSVSLRTVKDFLVRYHEGLPVEPFVRPAELVLTASCIPSQLKPTDACPRRNARDLVAAHAVPEKEDDWWTLVEIDTRTGLLANDLTPAEYVAKQAFLALPDNLTAWERNQALEWAKQLQTAAGEAPTEETSEEDLPVAITQPANGARLQGVVQITGRARSDDFEQYRLEFQPAGGGGDDWVLISISGSQITDGTLGFWDTNGLLAGPYSLRLVLVDEERGEISVRVEVLVVLVVDPVEPTATPSPTPVILPTETPPEEVQGRRRRKRATEA